MVTTLYIGETSDEFQHIWNNYKSIDGKNPRDEACMQEHLFEHFKSKGRSGFLGNVSITLVDKADGKDSKRRENYCRGHSKPILHLDLILKTVSEQSHKKIKMLLVGLPV